MRLVWDHPENDDQCHDVDGKTQLRVSRSRQDRAGKRAQSRKCEDNTDSAFTMGEQSHRQKSLKPGEYAEYRAGKDHARIIPRTGAQQSP